MTQIAALNFDSAETKFFFELTPDRILTAVESFGLETTGRCLQLNSMENRVYEVEVDVSEPPARSSDRFRIIKFYRPGRWTRVQILEEHQFLLDLCEYDIPVVAPLKNEVGETLLSVPDLDIYYAVFPKVGGRNPDEFTDEQLEQIGRLLARMHNVGAISPAAARLRLTPETIGLGSLEYIKGSGLLPPDVSARYESLVQEICETSAPLFERTTYHRIHGDCHLGNLLWGAEGPFWVDFDDMMQGPAVQDLWLMISGRDDESRRQMDVLLTGYQQMRDFDRRSLELIEPLRALRMIYFSAWIGKRWDDPAFPRTFGEFGTPRYWQEQIHQLQEQLELIQGKELF